MPQRPPSPIQVENQKLRETLDIARNEIELLSESLADVELAQDDVGWQSLRTSYASAFTREGLSKIASNAEVMAVASPLIKRGLALRNAYVWGQGLNVTARDPDINALVQGFLDDRGNRRSFTGTQAREELERALGTDGNIFLSLFTAPTSGQVQVRSTPLDEVRDVVFNPDDRDDPWLYLREFSTVEVTADPLTRATVSRKVTRRAYHPALWFWPTARPHSVDGVPVMWNAPILHVTVNRLDGTQWGIPDVFASLVWARGYESFLSDWARLVKALSRFAWRLSGSDTSRTAKAAAAARAATVVPAGAGSVPAMQPTGSGAVGGMVASDIGTRLEAIPKTGATIDSGSGRPLAAVVAAGLGVPVTMLLADPGITGARATAETLDKPTVLEMNQRRGLWASVYRDVLDYAVLQAVKAPGGSLAGTIGRDEWGRETVTFASNVTSTIDINFPDLDDLDPKTLIDAIKVADDTGKVPPLITLRLLLQALRVDDIDEIVEGVTGADGEWVGDAAAVMEAIRDLRIHEARGAADGADD